MKVDFEVLTDVRKEEMFAICLNDTLVHLESQDRKKKQTNKTTEQHFWRNVSCFQKRCWGWEQAHRISVGLVLHTGCQKGTASGAKVSRNH